MPEPIRPGPESAPISESELSFKNDEPQWMPLSELSPSKSVLEESFQGMKISRRHAFRSPCAKINSRPKSNNFIPDKQSDSFQEANLPSEEGSMAKFENIKISRSEFESSLQKLEVEKYKNLVEHQQLLSAKFSKLRCKKQSKHSMTTQLLNSSKNQNSEIRHLIQNFCETQKSWEKSREMSKDSNFDRIKFQIDKNTSSLNSFNNCWANYVPELENYKALLEKKHNLDIENAELSEKMALNHSKVSDLQLMKDRKTKEISQKLAQESEKSEKHLEKLKKNLKLQEFNLKHEQELLERRKADIAALQAKIDALNC
ncbi:MAG: hypothetical protein MHPSP_000780 [Paramarteilia canceri]